MKFEQLRNSISKFKTAIGAFLSIVLLLDLGYGSELLLKGSLIGGSISILAKEKSRTSQYQRQTGDFHQDGPSLGIGVGFSKWLGLLVSTKLAEGFPSGYSGDWMFAGSIFPIYLYLTSGLYSGKKILRPVFYGYAGKNVFPGFYSMDYLRLGCGVKWTFWAISFGPEVTWRRVCRVRSHTYRYSVSITLELGGWWGLRIGNP